LRTQAELENHLKRKRSEKAMKNINSSPIGSVELRRRTEECFKARPISRNSKTRVQRAVKKTLQLIQELQVYQIELERQSEALQGTLEELKTLLRRHTDFYDFAPMAPFTCDGDGTVPGEDPVCRTVLVVDNDPEKVAIISRYLHQEGYDTVMTPSGSEALNRGDGELPFPIALDIINPYTDGCAVLQGLRKHPETKEIPVITVSILEDRKTDSFLGAIGYVAGPVTMNRFDPLK
jgi:response regulator RpfG family c-di-GMP phosphodiesterase